MWSFVPGAVINHVLMKMEARLCLTIPRLDCARKNHRIIWDLDVELVIAVRVADGLAEAVARTLDMSNSFPVDTWQTFNRLMSW